MNHQCKVAVICALGVLFLAGCGEPRYWETLDDPYTLAAMDSMRQMSVCRARQGGGCVEDIGATVFAAGINRDYVVAARHAWSASEDIPNRDAVEYYYLVRRLEEKEKGPKEVVGPMTKIEFEAAKRKLQLPSFSRHFAAAQLND